jgi:hypothetical protein
MRLPARSQALSRELGELSSRHASLLQQLAECQGRVGELLQEAAGLQEQEGQGAGCFVWFLLLHCACNALLHVCDAPYY